MLYCEAAAESVEEKHRIFLDFMADEAHARGIEQSFKTTVTARNAPTTTNTTSEEKLPLETPKLASMSKTDSHMDADTDGEEYSPGGRPKLVHAETASHLNNKSTEFQTQTSNDQRLPSIGTTERSQTPIHAKSTVAEAIINTDDTPAATYRPYRHSVSANERAPSSGATVLTPTSSVAEETGRENPRQMPPLQTPYKAYSPPIGRTTSPQQSVSLPTVISPTIVPSIASRQEHGEIFLGRPPPLMSNHPAAPTSDETAPVSLVASRSMSRDPSMPAPHDSAMPASRDFLKALRQMLPPFTQAP
ncbi:hypothetical protein LTS18_001955, partial [Coniosporium uncinatum]